VQPVVVDKSGHVCSTWNPPHLTFFFNAMQDVQKATQSPMLAHFLECRRGLLAHFMRESGLRRDPTPTKESPAAGSTVPRWSYGLGQILDDTAVGLYATRSRLGPYSGKIVQIAKASPDGKWNPTTRSRLGSEDTGPYYLLNFMLGFEDFIERYFDAKAFFETGTLTPKAGLSESSAKSAATISSYFNKYKIEHPEVDVVAAVYRTFSGASSLSGMANLINTGHTTESMKWLEKYSNSLATQEADAKKTAGVA
jgi:hypothetical protein